MKYSYDLIISINVHEKPEYLKTQLLNISEFVNLNYKVILSCNEFMYESQSQYQTAINDEKLVINPEIINKKWAHGSLTKGIYSNMMFSLKNFNFKYFTVLSSREFFYRELNSIEDIKKTIIEKNDDRSSFYQIPGKNDDPAILSMGATTAGKTLNDYSVNDWHWPIFKGTKLFDYIKRNNLYFSSSPHEGLTFDYKSCLYISNFLEKEHDIREDIFNYHHCVEEFSLQTICCNYSCFYNIGNGINTMDAEEASKYRFTHKKIR